MPNRTMLTEDVLNYIERSVLCWVATVDANGMPNVSPKEVFAAYDASTVLIANIASPKTVRNLQANPQVCLSFIDIFVQKGYKLRGTADIVRPTDACYRELEKPLLAFTQGAFTIRSIIAIQVTAVEPIIAPRYRFMAKETTEASQIAAAMQTYGVMAQPNE